MDRQPESCRRSPPLWRSLRLSRSSDRPAKCNPDRLRPLENAHRRIEKVGEEKQACIRLPTSADDVVLPACAAARLAAAMLLTAGPPVVQQSIDISWPPRPQQQTRSVRRPMAQSSAGLTMWQMWQMPQASGLRGASGSREFFFSPSAVK